MGTIWFCLVAVMIAMYVLLDGFDLGAGIIHLGAARTDFERKQILASIGPVWDGNEVWLLAAGGTLYFAFPPLYAAGFSGFYLPLMIVLWLLILRGISIEFRSHIESPVWTPLWDFTFTASSALLAIFYGAALGNVVRGVPLDANGYFFEPLWTNFRVGQQNGILDWYTVLVGLAAYFAITMHGSLWVAWHTEGPVRERAQRTAKWAWLGTAIFSALTTWATFSIQPLIGASFRARPYGWALPLLAIGGLAAVRLFLRAESSRRAAFLSSCAYLLGMLTSVVFGVYPALLPSSTNPDYALTVANSSAPAYGLKIGLMWWPLGMLLAAGYFTFLYRHFFGGGAQQSRAH